MRRLNRIIYIHDEVSEQLERDRKELAPRFAMLCRQLGVSEWVRFKPTKGENSGWRRSPLGGHNGSHYYMWWLAAGSGPGKLLELKDQDIAIRSIRHHDLTDKKLNYGELDEYWEFKFAEELDDEQVLEQPWTEDQQQYIGLREECQILIGPPGSGKTSSLWRAVEVALLESRTLSTVNANHRRALYITWSQRLAESAEQYFNVMAPGEVQVYDLSSLYATALSVDIERLGINTSRQRFRTAVEGMKKKYNLKKKALTRPDRYYDLVRAWVIGRAPWNMKRVGDNKEVDEQELMIQEELKDALQLFHALTLTEADLMSIFPELQAATSILTLDISRQYQEGYSYVIVDEVQDLTPLELQAALHIAQEWSTKHPRLFIAGDEGQVVRPTFFEFSELNDLLFERGYHPQNTTLASNLRCPKVIADGVNRAKVFNRLLPSKYRPSDQGVRTSTYETEALLALSYFRDESEVLPLLETLSLNPNVHFIDLYEDEDRFKADYGYLGELQQLFNTSEMVKGLEFASVCLVGTSALIRSLTKERAKKDPIAFRLDVNRLRVAMSRAVEHLIFIEPLPMVNEELRALVGGQAQDQYWHSPSVDLAQVDLREGAVISLNALESLLAARDLSTDERVQGFMSRAERLFFDEHRALEAFNDLVTAVELAEMTQELSEDLQAGLNLLLARIALTEAFKKREERQLTDAQLMGSMLRDAVEIVGTRALKELMNIVKKWTEGDRSLENMRLLFQVLIQPHIRGLTWLSRIINEIKRTLFQDLATIAPVTMIALEHTDEILSFMGFDKSEATPLALEFKRQAFDHLIDHASWSEAEKMWQEVYSTEPSDLARHAKLFAARGQWLKAAELYEQLDMIDQSFKAYREAGALDEASRLLKGHTLESLESWSVTSLELLTVTNSFFKRYPLTSAEKLSFFQYGSDDMEQLRKEVSIHQTRLNEQFNLLKQKEVELQSEQDRLNQENDLLKQARYRVEAKETELKRRDRDLQRGVRDLDSHLSGIQEAVDSNRPAINLVALTETIDALPALGVDHIYESDLRAREEEMIVRAQALSDRELNVRRQQNHLNILKERMDKARQYLENEQSQLDEQRQFVNEQSKGVELKELALNRQGEEQAQKELSLLKTQKVLNMREQALSKKETDLSLEIEQLQSQVEKAARQEKRALEAVRKQSIYDEELNQRAERLEQKTKALEERLKELEGRESKLEEHSQQLSAYHPALLEPHADYEVDWIPKYTATDIQVVSAELTRLPQAIPAEKLQIEDVSPQDPRDPEDIDDTAVDLQPIIKDEYIQLPAWFEHSSHSKVISPGELIIDEIEDLALHLMYCPSGSHLMGSDQGEPAERPRHKVTISRPLLIGQSLVTQRLWALVMGSSPSRFIDPDRPVERVNWFEAVTFCNRLSALGGYQPVYTPSPSGHHRTHLEANGYRLPTEAEWEYIAKAGQESLFAGGQRALDVAWSSRSAAGETKPVMQKKANAWGIYDMCGNVAEWCGDVATAYDHRPKALIDPLFDAEVGDRVIRGGAWSCSAYLCRIASRGSAPGHARGPDIGLRVCRPYSSN